METKTCRKCGRELSLSEFYYEYSKNRGKSYYRSACKECERDKGAKWRQEKRKNPKQWKAYMRANNLKRHFGLTVADYNRMLKAQDGGCAACGGQNIAGRRLAVDHDHETGEVRGLLCHHCNAAIGHVDESVSRLLQIIAYVEAFKERK